MHYTGYPRSDPVHMMPYEWFPEINQMSVKQAFTHCNGQVLPMLTLQTMQAVVSNASMWDTLPLLPAEAQPKSMQQAADDTPMNRSFMHLHLGFDATGEGLDCM